MDYDFDIFFYCWGEFLKCSTRVYTFLFISKFHPNTEIIDRNLSPSKGVTFLYVGSYVSLIITCKYISQIEFRKLKKDIFSVQIFFTSLA